MSVKAEMKQKTIFRGPKAPHFSWVYNCGKGSHPDGRWNLSFGSGLGEAALGLGLNHFEPLVVVFEIGLDFGNVGFNRAYVFAICTNR